MESRKRSGAISWMVVMGDKLAALNTFAKGAPGHQEAPAWLQVQVQSFKWAHDGFLLLSRKSQGIIAGSVAVKAIFPEQAESGAAMDAA